MQHALQVSFSGSFLKGVLHRWIQTHFIYSSGIFYSVTGPK